MAEQVRRGLFATLREFFGGAPPSSSLPPSPLSQPPPRSAPFPLGSPPAPTSYKRETAPPPLLPPVSVPRLPAPRPAHDATYRQRDGLLTPTEGEFYRALRTGVGERWHIVTKVRLADLVAPLPGREWQTAWNRIAVKHVDFALCEPDTLHPRLVIELDDRSHRRPDRIERDAFVDRVFAEAALPILHVPVRRTYDPWGLAGQIVAILAAPPNGASHTHGADSNAASEPLRCERCGGELRQRVARRGRHAGEVFWGCVNYPRCRYILSGED